MDTLWHWPLPCHGRSSTANLSRPPMIGWQFGQKYFLSLQTLNIHLMVKWLYFTQSLYCWVNQSDHQSMGLIQRREHCRIHLLLEVMMAPLREGYGHCYFLMTDLTKLCRHRLPLSVPQPSSSLSCLKRWTGFSREWAEHQYGPSWQSKIVKATGPNASGTEQLLVGWTCESANCTPLSEARTCCKRQQDETPVHGINSRFFWHIVQQADLAGNPESWYYFKKLLDLKFYLPAERNQSLHEDLQRLG